MKLDRMILKDRSARLFIEDEKISLKLGNILNTDTQNDMYLYEIEAFMTNDSNEKIYIMITQDIANKIMKGEKGLFKTEFKQYYASKNNTSYNFSECKFALV